MEDASGRSPFEQVYDAACAKREWRRAFLNAAAKMAGKRTTPGRRQSDDVSTKSDDARPLTKTQMSRSASSAFARVPFEQKTSFPRGDASI